MGIGVPKFPPKFGGAAAYHTVEAEVDVYKAMMGDAYPVLEPGDLVTITHSATHMKNVPPEDAIDRFQAYGEDHLFGLTGYWESIVPEGEEAVGLVVGYLSCDNMGDPERFYFILVNGALLSFPYLVGVMRQRSLSDAVQLEPW